MTKHKFHPVKRPGALTKKADAAGESVQEFASQHYNDSGLTGQQARFAKIAKSWHHGKVKAKPHHFK
ncbi:MAG TPA: hypothetical protein VFR02_10085 [bacterium]|nr:hypothetical protein [bacterium]